MNKDVIIALDFDSFLEVKNFLEKFSDEKNKPYVKVGMELYYQEGEKIISYLKDQGYKIFLDLKLFDIPNTVFKALEVLKKYDIEIINVHALGGKSMMKKAKEVFKGSNTLVIAVTVLTSVDQNDLNDLHINKQLNEFVLTLATNAKDSGLDGVVCSAHEVKNIKQSLRESFITITPGIRDTGDSVDDQKRFMTPKEAKETSTDYIVVGRSITTSIDPVNKYKKIKQDFLGGNDEF